jgi:hypothetical protein
VIAFIAFIRYMKSNSVQFFWGTSGIYFIHSRSDLYFMTGYTYSDFEGVFTELCTSYSHAEAGSEISLQLLSNIT